MRLMRNAPVRDPHCMDCGVDTDRTEENYMVNDDLWRTAVPIEAGFVCVGCFEKRLSRKLRRADFRPYMQSAFDNGMPVSDRLRSRLRR
jgi:hypothetical protein